MSSNDPRPLIPSPITARRAIRRLLCAGTAMLALAGLAAPLRAQTVDTLVGALVSTYLTNPTLEAQRAEQRATTELVPQARSGYRPQLSFQSNYGRTRIDREGIAGLSGDGAIPGAADTGRDNPVTLDTFDNELVLDQPLYRGGRTVNANRQAEALVAAGRNLLSATEQEVLLNSVIAYMEVLRSEAVVELNRNNVEVLQEQLEASRARFEVGEVTRTDVAQSQAALAFAESNLRAAVGQFENARTTFERVVGYPAGQLAPPPPLPELPETLQAAMEISLAENPQLQAAEFTEVASRYNVKVAQGQHLPTLNLQGALSYSEESAIPEDETKVASVLGRLQFPLYQSGRVASEVRQARQENSRDRLEIAATRRQVLEQVAVAWENLRTARAVTESARSQVRANIIALEGVRQENLVGARTVLDVLEAEQTLLNSRVTLVTAERDAYVAGFQLLAAIGRMSVQFLDLPVAAYDPEVYYEEVRGKWFDASTYELLPDDFPESMFGD